MEILILLLQLCVLVRSAAFFRTAPHSQRVGRELQRHADVDYQSSVDLQVGMRAIRERSFLTSLTLLKAWGARSQDFSAAHADSSATEYRPYAWLNDRKRHERQAQRSSTALMMGKGDGKKKPKKKKAKAAPRIAPKSSEPAPLRVSSDINIPVRKQIAWANMNKQYRQQNQGSFRQKRVVRTSYRRSWDEEEIEEKAQERKRKGQNPDWDVILNQTAASPLMIVDGYNVIHKWPRLKKHMTKGDPARARQLLVDDLENLQSLKGWRIECVFDGTKRSTRGPLGHSVSSNTRAQNQANKKSVSKHGIRVVFSGIGIEADTYIEARCSEAKNVTEGKISGSLIVATDDAMIRLAGQSAGAMCMSADRFVNELKSVKKAVEYKVEAAVAKVNGHAVRPASLRGRKGISAPTKFGRRSVLIEDKRNRTKTKRIEDEDLYDIDVSKIKTEVDENGIPWWAVVPNQTNTYRNENLPNATN